MKLLHQYRCQAEAALDVYIADIHPENPFAESLKFSLEPKGKLFRPVLVYCHADALGINAELLDSYSVAIQLVHVASLLHDDLPALDDDDYRRGRLATHKAFDEATSILLADYLNGEAIRLLIREENLSDREKVCLVTELSSSIAEVACGQLMDMTSEGQKAALMPVHDSVLRRYRLKTGSLIAASLRGPLVLTEGDKIARNMEHINTIADTLSLLFQIRDDLNAEVEPERIHGKLENSDRKRNLDTMISIMRVEELEMRVAGIRTEGAKASGSLNYSLVPIAEAIEELAENCEHLLQKLSK